MPLILQIVREILKPGCEAAYKIVEDEIAEHCARLGCPHPHLALAPLSGPSQVWWLNLFESEAERDRVTQAYLANRPLMAALGASSQRKAALTERPVEAFAFHRQDLGDLGPRPWVGARCLVVANDATTSQPGGSVFETSDGTRYRLMPFRSGEEAAAANADGRGEMLAVRPDWGVPARDWSDADPEFWAINPSVRHGR